MIRNLALALLLFALTSSAMAGKKSALQKQQNSLDEYIRQFSAPAPAPPVTTRGSLFTASGLLADPYSDFKARLVGDSISIQILESTTISQSGNIATERDFSHSSGVTGVGGQSPSFLNPLLAANSSTKLTGTGATASKSSLNTTLTAQVVAVLPTGSLIVEARRHVLANHQHEDVVLRGVVRPADISSGNLVYSYQISNLQLEVKGKGVISDSVRQPNIVMRTLLKLIGF
jgi:flagellar L-ring protein precursor FlgH